MNDECLNNFLPFLESRMGRQIYKDLPSLDYMLEYVLKKLCEL